MIQQIALVREGSNPSFSELSQVAAAVQKQIARDIGPAWGIEATVDAARLQVDTTLVPTGDRPVPISFGYHPYLCLPGERRADIRLRLPERRHLELDDRQLPTGRAHAEPAEDEPLGARTFDDLYELGDDRRLGLTGGRRRIVVELGDGYHHAQVFTPPGSESVCLEPMTAPVNALVDGGAALEGVALDVTATNPGAGALPSTTGLLAGSGSTIVLGGGSSITTGGTGFAVRGDPAMVETSDLDIEATGDKAEEAVRALGDLIDARFGEPE